MIEINSCGQLIINGDFATGDFTGWTVSAGTAQKPVVSNGQAVLATADKITQDINAIAGTELTFIYDFALVNSATGYVEVVSLPSRTRVYYDYNNESQPGVVITVPDDETGLEIAFACNAGGEVHVDNVTLQPMNSELIIGGDFTDDSIPGWTAHGATSENPKVVGGHLQLPNASYVYQDVAVTAGCTLSLSYSMQLLYSATGNVTVTAQTTGQELYIDTIGGSITGASFVVPVGESIVRIQFNCTQGGEIDVDNVSMVYI